MTRPTLFISYAHKDGLDFTRRLAFALSLYVDVFWDRRLQAGEYPQQLLREIEAKDHFLLVMTPCSVVSAWCRREIAHAEKHLKPITLAMVFSPEETGGDDLVDKYTYGSFLPNFEEGFRRVTMMILGSPLSSWEALMYANQPVILECLRRGYVPGLISKEIVDWLMVEKVWGRLNEYIERQNSEQHTRIFRGIPRTPTGVLSQSQLVMQQFEKERDSVGNYLAKLVVETLQPLLKELIRVNDDAHLQCGEIAYKVYEAVQNILYRHAVGTIDAEAGFYIKQGGYFDFDVAEKLKELVSIHARRSRDLY